MGSAPSNLVSNGILVARIEDNATKSLTLNEPSVLNEDYSVLDDEQPYEEMSLNMQKLEKSFQLISNLKTSSNILKNKRAFKSFLFMSKLSMIDEFRESRTQYDLLAKYKIVINIFAEIYSNCFEDVKNFVSFYEFLNDSNKKGDSKFQKLKIIYLFINNLNNLVWLFTECSHIFRLNFHESGATTTFINFYLNNQEFVLNCLKFKFEISKRDDNFAPGLQMLRALIGICHNLTKLIDNTKTDWTKIDACSKLMTFSQTIYKYPDIRLSTYMALANVMCENDIEKLNTTDIIKDIVKIIKLGSESISSKINLKRIKISLDVDENSNTEAAVISHRDSQYNIVELLETLNRIAVNDHIKYSLYKDYEMNQTLKVIIMDGNYIG
jgi:hypothetical protein